MTPQEVIDHADLTLETIEAKNEAEGGCVECDRKHKEFLRAVIECAKKAMIVDEARKLAARIKPEDIPWKVEEGGNGNGNDR